MTVNGTGKISSEMLIAHVEEIQTQSGTDTGKAVRPIRGMEYISFKGD